MADPEDSPRVDQETDLLLVRIFSVLIALLAIGWPLMLFASRQVIIAGLGSVILSPIMLIAVVWFSQVNATATALVMPYLAWTVMMVPMGVDLYQLNPQTSVQE